MGCFARQYYVATLSYQLLWARGLGPARLSPESNTPQAALF